MTNKKFSTIVLVSGLLMVGCSTVLDADRSEDVWLAEVHLQEGFERHWVSVELNGEVCYEDYLDGAASQARPLATFHLDVPRGTRHMIIRVVPIDGNQRAQASMLELPGSMREFRYIGLTVSGNSIYFTVQEDPFRYV